MPNFSAVSKSKRTPVRLRHKIEKASAAKQRKLRKEAKKVSCYVMAQSIGFSLETESSVEISPEKGSRYSKSVPIQREDPRRN